MRLISLVVAFFASVVQAAPVTLQLNWKPEPQFGGFYAAQVHEHFKNAGLDVNVVPGGAGTPTIQMAGAGRVEFAVVSGDELVIARSRGIDLVALFAVYQTNPQGIMTRASRGFAKIDDVFANEGILAMQKGLPYALYLEKKFGLGKLQVVPSPFGDLTAYRSRENYAMQCFVTSEPLAARKIGIEPTTFLIADAGWNPYTTVVVAKRDYIERNREQVTKMVQAINAGWRSYLDDPSKTNQAMRQLNPSMDEQTFVESAAAQKPLIETAETRSLGLGAMTVDRWQTLIDQMRDLKLIDGDVNAAELFEWKSK